MSGWDTGSIMVTEHPWCRAAAATSQPIQPAPTMTIRAPSVSRDLMASASSRLRRVKIPSRSDPGIRSRRGRDPVASTNLS